MGEVKKYCVEISYQEEYTFISEPDFWDSRERPITTTRIKYKRKYFRTIIQAKKYVKENGGEKFKKEFLL